MSSVAHPHPVSLRKVALPVEHGGWGIVFEPVVLGLLVAPSPAAAFIALAAAGAFLARQPLKIAMNDVLLRHRRYPRTEAAIRFAIGYGSAALVALIVAVLLAGPRLLLPVLIAAPFAAVQILYDAKNGSRSVIPEVAGALAMGASASMMGIAAGLQPAIAWALWAVISARTIAAVLYVRSRLQLEHGQGLRWKAAVGGHLLALAGILALRQLDLAPLLAIVAFGALTGRSIVGLSPWRGKIGPKQVGWREIGWGTGSVLLIGLGYLLEV